MLSEICVKITLVLKRPVFENSRLLHQWETLRTISHCGKRDRGQKISSFIQRLSGSRRLRIIRIWNYCVSWFREIINLSATYLHLFIPTFELPANQGSTRKMHRKVVAFFRPDWIKNMRQQIDFRPGAEAMGVQLSAYPLLMPDYREV